jgi:hypothetical protein
MVTATTAAVLKALVADCRPALSDRNRFLMNHAAPAASEDLASAADGLRTALRLATLPAHTRLHGHPGLGAVQAGTIDRRAYRALLSRLYGFHVPFEAAAGIEPERSRWLAADLQALGLDEPAIAGLPRCGYVPRLETEARRLGAAYVVEGSTLGRAGAIEAARSLVRSRDDRRPPLLRRACRRYRTGVAGFPRQAGAVGE